LATLTAGLTDITALSGLKSLWAETLGDPRICVAILDGPVDQSHPCFEGVQFTQLQTLIPGVADKGWASQHGTHVASIIFGQQGSPVYGIAPGCRGLIVPIFSNGAEGSLAPCSQIDLARAITQAVEQGAHVINISGGQLTSGGESGHLLARAVQLCADKNVLIVAAAGNDGCECLHIPAALPTVLTVGAIDAQGNPMNSSNWGEAYQTQGILALGENILGAVSGGGTAVKSGTSFATPIVSGIVALLLSIQLQQGNQPNPHAIREVILNSALPCNSQAVADCRRHLVGSLSISKAQALVTQQQGGIKNLLDQKENLGMIQPSEIANTGEGKPEAEMPQLIEASKLIQAEVFHQSSVGIQAGMVIPMMPTDGVFPSGDAEGKCTSCGGGGGPQFVYAIGTVGYDFGTQARRDSIVQDAIGVLGNSWNPNDPVQVLENFERQPWEAPNVIWTLSLQETPIYAIMPNGPYANVGYERLRQFLREQLTEGVERVSIPGIVGGSVRLLSGQTVPVIVPALRGMSSWSTAALVNAIIGVRPTNAAAQTEYEQRTGGIQNFLERVYYELRNLGTTSHERAINYAATNAFQLEQVFEQAVNENMELDTIDVEKSPLCRDESECWDVKLVFFNPAQRHQQAKKVYRFTVDVSDVVPVTIGRVRCWSMY
jgi:cyanobactin maturation PatA/PatG family protease